MIKFYNKQLGVLEAPNNESVIEQYRKHKDLYSEIYEVDLDNKIENPKDYSKYTLKELKNEADNNGLLYNKKATKSEIIAILEENK